MGRAPCCQKVGLKRGRWTAEEDQILIKYIQDNGEGSWRALPKNAGLLRCGKSCRLRWINYLRTDLKRGNITPLEEDLIIKLHATIGNRWSLIATQLPGRTDNEIKNHWNSHLSRSINTWRRPANDTLPKHILDSLAKLMAKPEPSIKKESKKNAPIKIIATDRDNKTIIAHEEMECNNEKHTMPDGYKESAVPSNSWSTDESLERIFSLVDHQDLVEGFDEEYVGLLSLNEMVTPLMDNLIIMPHEPEHVSNEFQNIDDDGGGAIDIEFMSNLMTNLGASHAEMDTPMTMVDNVDIPTLIPSLPSSPYNFYDDTMIMNMINNDRSCWDDYGETLYQDMINHEEVGSFLMPWLWNCDDVESSGL